MSKPGLIYRLIVQNAEKLADQQTFDHQIIYVDISDTDYLIDDLDEATVVLMTGAGVPVELSTIDNSEDVFTTIRATQLTIRVLSSLSLGVSNFSSGSAQRWSVDAYLNNDITKLVFKGFLVMADLSEAFMSHPHEIVLVANDGIGLLKDIPLTDFDGNNPTGYNRIADYLAWALSKTGLSLQLNTVFNIRHGFGVVPIAYANFSTIAGGTIFFPTAFYTQLYEGAIFTVACTGANNGATFTVLTNNSGASLQVSPSPVNQSGVIDAVFTDITHGHLFDKIFLDAKTFEDKVGTSINCYEVIQKILGEEAELFQRNGQWWILRINELETGPLYVSTFDDEGVFIENLATADYDKDIGKDGYVIFFSDEGTVVSIDMSHKEVKLIFNYETPLEIPCNIDFERGDVIDDSDPLVKTYEIDCWTFAKYSGVSVNPETFPAPDTVAYINRTFVNDYEKTRFIVLPLSAAQHVLFSEHILIGEDDKFEISIDFKWAADKSGGGVLTKNIFEVILWGEDDTKWFLDTDGVWYESDATWTTNHKQIQLQWIPDDVNEQEWRTVSVSCEQVPVSGKLYIALHANQSGGSSIDDTDVHFMNLQFDYIPFINGSYKKYTGQSHTVEQAINNKVKRETQVYISDSPKKLFKGALAYHDGTDYVLTKLFYDGAVNTYPASSSHQSPYGQIQSFDVWNQFRKEMRIFQAQCQGLDSGSEDTLNRVDMINFLHKFILRDANLHTNSRRFTMLSNSIFWNNAEWDGVLREVYNEIYGKDYEGHSFKYLT